MTNTPPENDDNEVPIDEIFAGETAEPPADAPAAESPARPASLIAAVVERKDAPDECTLYPADAADETLVTEWIIAKEGSYVELDMMR